MTPRFLVSALALLALVTAGLSSAASLSLQTRIAFISARPGGTSLDTVLPNGRRAHRVLKGAGLGSPAWSPNGRRIAFTVAGGVGQGIKVVAATGGRAKVLVAVSSQFNSDPAWSPDGRRIAFDRDGKLYTIGANGRGLKSLGVAGRYPSWSPDGRRLAFSNNASGAPGGSRLYVMKASGSGRGPIAGTGGSDLYPRWSPNGRLLAFVAVVDGNYDVHTVPVKGGTVRRLTSSPGQDLSPSWSPDGRQLVFASNRKGPFNLYTMKANGSQQRRIAKASYDQSAPAWQPRTAR